jgi:hypothetical protein
VSRWGLGKCAVLLAAIVVPACSPPTPTGGPPASGADERIELREVPVPATVTGARFPWFTADGEGIVFSGIPAGGDRSEVLFVRENGSGYRCLTCGIAPDVAEPLLKPIAFRDDRRVMVRVGDQSVVQAADHAVLECHPDVRRCASAELVPITIPPPGAAAVIQDQREFRVAPDGRHVGFTQVLATPSGESVMTSVVATLARTAHSYELRDPRVVSTRGELKSFTPDGRAVLVAAFTTNPYEAANPDVLRIDLAAGRESRVTSYPDYDEPVELSPDGRWYVVGSGRTSGLFETVAQVRRPNFIGPGIGPLTATLFINHREQLIEPWLVRTGTEARGATGQRLDPDAASDGYHGQAIANWSPDGTRIVFSEGRAAADQGGGRATRVVVAHLADRTPVPARRPAARAPEPAWAPPLGAFVPEPERAPRSLDGRRGGAVTVSAHPAAGRPGWTVLDVTYRAFSDEPGWVIDGHERAEYQGGASGQTHYTAHLTVTGRHRGFLRADATISPARITGSIDSEVDGHHLHLP